MLLLTTIFIYRSQLNRDGRWTILPSEGFVEPESETDLTLSLYLLDAESCTNKAVIQFEKVKDIVSIRMFYHIIAKQRKKKLIAIQNNYTI